MDVSPILGSCKFRGPHFPPKKHDKWGGFGCCFSYHITLEIPHANLGIHRVNGAIREEVKLKIRQISVQGCLDVRGLVGWNGEENEKKGPG